MKKFFTVLMLCAALALQACMYSVFDLNLRIVKVNETTMLQPNNGYSFAPGVSLPCGIRIIQNGSQEEDDPVLIKLQYAVYRKFGNAYIKVIPVTTVVTLGNVSGTALVKTGTSAKNYFGTVKIRPDKNLVKANDYIVIRVWASNGFLTNADETADLDLGQLELYAPRLNGYMIEVGGGWTPAYAVCVKFNGKWGAR